ncbi:PREDICTED: protein RCC2 homolog [Branchiostoma belcheri]|uniref:Protein RCC2 homolog n=1 Tax=Branchiostoma belcheri TaxID=7741 RepID=A0A6P4ZUV6_BRABE|nr:PREDICTED: protein RCC2 homolog [Branchiostoma belcheri]
MPPKKRKAGEEEPQASKKGKSDENGEEVSEEGAAAAADNGHGAAAETSQPAAADKPPLKLEGSKVSGELLICGGTNWDLIGRNQLPKNATGSANRGQNLWGPHRYGSMSGVRVRSVFSGPTAVHSVLITEDGKAMSWGRNDKGQLGHGDMKRVDVPTVIESLAGFNIVEAACGRNHTLCLTDDGKVFAFGENKMGQLGLGNENPAVPSPTQIVYTGPPVVKVACGAEFSMVVDCRGALYSFGCPEYGQLGNNTDGQYFVTSNKMAYDCELVPRRISVFIEKTKDGFINPITNVQLVDIKCGTNHTVAMDKQKRVYTWGFGGYGRLGHSEQKDEHVPRLVKMFDYPGRGARTIYAGAFYSMAILDNGGQLYLWGQTKTTGEANMYPKPIQDLSGWDVRSVGCSNRSIVVAADDSTISWGPSPTYGELGYGENKAKSSTIPKEVKTLDGVYIHRVSCGYGHTIFIARNDSEEDKAKIKALPEYNPK